MADITPPAVSQATPQTAPGFLYSALRVFDLSLGQMLWSRRTIFMILVVGVPVLLALIVRMIDSLRFSCRSSSWAVAGSVVSMK